MIQMPRLIIVLNLMMLCLDSISVREGELREMVNLDKEKFQQLEVLIIFILIKSLIQY